VSWADAGGKVLLVDDDPTLLRSLAQALRVKGYDVVAARDGDAAVRLVHGGEFDAILSDIAMPGMDGIQLLQEVRDHDFYLPVVLMTGEPAVATAVKAVEYGAFHYLTKPTSLEELTRVLGRAVGLGRMARVKHEAAEMLGNLDGQAADRAGLEAAFSRALAGLWVAFQPIVRADCSVYAYEALMRSEEPALPHPAALLGAAERLGCLEVLGRTIRDRAAARIVHAPADQHLFVNCHPLDLMDDQLYEPQALLSQQAARVVLEVTERSSLDEVTEVRTRVGELRTLGFRIAIDDFGAGYAGLTSFAQLEPEIVKMDLSIVRDVEKSRIKQKVIRSTTTLAKDMGILVVAEGVETLAERDCLLELGVDLLQGFLFAKPGRSFPEVSRPVPEAQPSQE
jgi:EAL domain-containing protein (putative c-di-GMP-specific phosphodiesterase class I)/CheY-like chemotaxis protein